MDRYICIHGHFYQPPRENAWLEFVEQQDSAYPFHDWNERITAECYAPNATARILDGEGRIVHITNNYSRISFNFGPTLLAWLAEKEPDVYQAILTADRESQERFSGHGSALAQSYNHTILPLSNSRDKHTQIVWGIRDFEHRFGRKPEGMWLPETAVDIETLGIMAELGIRFTILSPYQAKRSRRKGGRAWRDASGGRVDPSTPYEIRLPSRKRISVFFYDGPISRGIAFEGLLQRGEDLADRLASAFSAHRTWPQIVHIATDGETYGHHHRHGDMALAYAMHHIEATNSAKLTNYGEFLEKHPPTQEAEIWERSAWSCSHGVERWNSNCGCNSGGHEGWNQEWRGPLRAALDWLRDTIAPRYEQKAAELLSKPWDARNDYIDVILDRSGHVRDRFFAQHAVRTLDESEEIIALKLLEMQRHAMLMYTSCGWFFDELSGIETTQVIQYAGRTLQLFEELFGESLEIEFLQRLELAKSNIPEHGDGRIIYDKFVRPAMIDRKKVAAHYALSSLFQSYPDEGHVYCYSVKREDFHFSEAGRSRLAMGRCRITSEITQESEVLSFGALHIGDHLMNAGVRVYRGEDDYSTLKHELADPFTGADFPGVLRILDRHFGQSTYSLASIFHDDQRHILGLVLKSTLSEAENVYRQLYDTHAPMMRFMHELRTPLPKAYQTAAEFALNRSLRELFADTDNLNFIRIHALLQEAASYRVALDGDTLGHALWQTIRSLSEELQEDPSDTSLMERLEAAAGLAKSLPFEVAIHGAQNIYYGLLQHVFPKYVERARAGDVTVKSWIDHFVGLGNNLFVHVERPTLEKRSKVS
jgi:alpha-amylase/alpha-mannosidase (GH57 family)